MKFGAIKSLDKIDIMCYTDATHASLEDYSSQGANVILLQGERGPIPISWQSKKLDRVTKSPIASEASALSDGADSAYLIACQLKEIFPKSCTRVSCFTDNKSLVDTLKTTKVHRDKRLMVDVARIKEMVSEGEIKVSWVQNTQQLADALTKRGASTESLVEVLRM